MFCFDVQFQVVLVASSSWVIYPLPYPEPTLFTLPLRQRVAYRIGNLSNADISDFFVYRIVYRIEPPISSISIFSKPMIFLSFFAENSKKSPKILKIRRKFAENSENSPKIQKIRRKFWKFAENSSKRRSSLRPSYRIVSYRIEKKTLISYRYRIESKKSLSLLSGLNRSKRIFDFDQV